jgi:hypothetical protein
MIEITDLNRLLQLDHTVTQSVHWFAAYPGQYVTGNIAQNTPVSPGPSALWSFQSSNKRALAFGNYYSYLTGNGATIEFWMGIYIENNTVSFYLWFGIEPPITLRPILQSIFLETIERREYWYSPRRNPMATLNGPLCTVGDGSDTGNSLEDILETVIREYLNALTNTGTETGKQA